MKISGFNRRQFLHTALVGSTGALVSPLVSPAETHAGEATSEEKKIIKRTLGKTGLELPIVSFGVQRADSPGLVHEAIKAGIIYFDTAHSYQRGKNEEMLGEVLKGYPRDSFIVSTKVEAESYDKKTGAFGPGVTSKAFLDRFDISLKRLNMDYVDILYVHNIMTQETALFPAMLEGATAAKKAGKARHIGISTHRNEPEVIQAAIDSGAYEVVLTAFNYKQEHFGKVKSAIAKAAEAGLGVVAMKTMAGGYHDKERTKPVNGKAALKYILQDENVTSALPGIINFDHLTMDTAVNYDLTLTTEEQSDLALNKSEGGLYCQGCERCVPNCPKGLPLPEIMRAYMYMYGYSSAQQAHDLLTSLNISSTPCSGCSSCSARCARGFDLSERVTDIARLLDVPRDFVS
jgi:predicted aldo/keto reductase-like oxidoreductase